MLATCLFLANWFGAKKAVEIGFANKTEASDDNDPEEPNKIVNSVLDFDEKKKIINELKSALKTNNQIQEPVPTSASTVDDKGNGSFNLLKKWR